MIVPREVDFGQQTLSLLSQNEKKMIECLTHKKKPYKINCEFGNGFFGFEAWK